MFKFVKPLLLLLLFSFSLASLAQGQQEIIQLAEQGEAKAQAKLASMYLLGWQGFEQNNELAAKWMKKAADQGIVDAQVVMGALYDRGLGVPGDRDMATKWYEKAAAQGHGTSLAILGRNDTAKGSVKFSYQAMRLNAARSIPREYAKRFLMSK
ncbi:tetratricopeptide repeat protein [Methylomarinum vadi]|uniref:tetratricopeptide repeat protein n=1 Tax=Methylomarinum vadi TaxID=438855 RepID=UPI0004DF5F82|nr:tetratricopeptide repeat protein [Methylomarinum vadi]